MKNLKLKKRIVALLLCGAILLGVAPSSANVLIFFRVFTISVILLVIIKLISNFAAIVLLNGGRKE